MTTPRKLTRPTPRTWKTVSDRVQIMIIITNTYQMVSHRMEVFVTLTLNVSACLTDIRMDTKWFPMSAEENSINQDIKLADQAETTDSCERDDCAGNVCATLGKICIPLWGLHKCV